jgi:hypothetical protein
MIDVQDPNGKVVSIIRKLFNIKLVDKVVSTNKESTNVSVDNYVPFDNTGKFIGNSECIMVTVAPLGRSIMRIVVFAGSSIADILKRTNVNYDLFEDIRLNGKLANKNTLVRDNDIITMVPKLVSR